MLTTWWTCSFSKAFCRDTDLSSTRSACIAVFVARAQHPWTPQVAALSHWPPIYSGALEGLDHLELAATVEGAAEAVRRFVQWIDGATDT